MAILPANKRAELEPIIMIRAIRRWLLYVGLVFLLVACSSQPPDPLLPTPPPTPAEELLQVSGTSTAGSRLSVTLPLIKLNHRPPEDKVQLFQVMADAHGTYSYMLYPANDAGYAVDQFNLTDYPLEISLNENTSAVSLWILAVHNTHYYAAEMFGLDALVASLGLGFRNWLADGDPHDDPLAAVVSASNGVLYEWFAGIDVLGQNMITFEAANGWDVGLGSQASPDDGMNAVYSVHYVSADDVALLPSPTPVPVYPGYSLLVDDTFSGGTSAQNWYQDQDNTYANHIVDGAYEIRLTDLPQREFGISWGSIEGAQFKNYILEADVSLLEDNLTDAQYGIWFHYQDDFNFIYFGLSNQGEYRVAVIKDNSTQRTIQDWTPHPAIHPGAATNTLTIEAWSDGMITLSVNGEQLLAFNDTTYESGSVAFFCRSTTVPATCHLTNLRIWQADAE
jgi:hypothetical protein